MLTGLGDHATAWFQGGSRILSNHASLYYRYSGFHGAVPLSAYRIGYVVVYPTPSFYWSPFQPIVPGQLTTRAVVPIATNVFETELSTIIATERAYDRRTAMRHHIDGGVAVHHRLECTDAGLYSGTF